MIEVASGCRMTLSETWDEVDIEKPWAGKLLDCKGYCGALISSGIMPPVVGTSNDVTGKF